MGGGGRVRLVGGLCEKRTISVAYYPYPFYKTVEILFWRGILTAKFVPLATFLSLQIALFFVLAATRCCTRRFVPRFRTIKCRNHKLYYMTPPERVVTDRFLQRLASFILSL